MPRDRFRLAVTRVGWIAGPKGGHVDGGCGNVAADVARLTRLYGLRHARFRYRTLSRMRSRTTF